MKLIIVVNSNILDLKTVLDVFVVDVVAVNVWFKRPVTVVRLRNVDDIGFYYQGVIAYFFAVETGVRWQAQALVLGRGVDARTTVLTRIFDAVALVRLFALGSRKVGNALAVVLVADHLAHLTQTAKVEWARVGIFTESPRESSVTFTARKKEEVNSLKYSNSDTKV